MSGMEVRQGEAWPSFGECEGVFISFKLFSPADGHPWQLCLQSTRMDPSNPGNNVVDMNYYENHFVNKVLFLQSLLVIR